MTWAAIVYDVHGAEVTMDREAIEALDRVREVFGDVRCIEIRLPGQDPVHVHREERRQCGTGDKLSSPRPKGFTKRR